METIALIASLICGLTALTTSLRARGRSREVSRSQIISELSSSGRAEGIQARDITRKGHRPSLYLIVTLIWYGLAILFALPVMHRLYSAGETNKLIVLAAVLILFFLCSAVIWISFFRNA